MNFYGVSKELLMSFYRVSKEIQTSETGFLKGFNGFCRVNKGFLLFFEPMQTDFLSKENSENP